MNKSTIEEELLRSGQIVQPNVGDSMMPLLKQGRDLMIIDRKPEGRCKRLDAVLYRRPDGKYVMHRILKVRKDDYVICGDNRCNKEYGVPDSWILGVLTGVIRKGKQISVRDWRYLLYVHLWCDFFPIRSLIIRVIRRLQRRNRKK